MADRRKRMSTTGGGPGGGPRSTEAAAIETTPSNLGIEKVWDNVPDGKHAYCVFSKTDDRMEKVTSYNQKESEVIAKGDKAKEWMQSSVGFGCHKGMKPESPNQDCLSALMIEDQFALYGVYDGHGPEGHFASHEALRTLNKNFLSDPEFLGNPGETLFKVFQQTQETLSKQKAHDYSASGATCTVAFHDYTSQILTVAHVGDSRSILAYRKKGKSSWDALELTQDHKPDLPQEKRRIESADPPGRVEFDGYFNHRVFSRKGMYPGLNMSRALGDLVAHREAGLTAKPDVVTVNLREGKVRKTFPEAAPQDIELLTAGEEIEQISLLICTDGVWEFIDNKKAIDTLQKNGVNQDGVFALTKMSYDEWMKDSDNEITDDITAMLINIR